jgi:hypothetical protein
VSLSCVSVRCRGRYVVSSVNSDTIRVSDLREVTRFTGDDFIEMKARASVTSRTKLTENSIIVRNLSSTGF